MRGRVSIYRILSDSVKCDLRIHLAWGGVHWQAFVNVVMNLRFA